MDQKFQIKSKTSKIPIETGDILMSYKTLLFANYAIIGISE